MRIKRKKCSVIKCKNREFVSTFVKVFQDCFIELHSSATIETRTASVMFDMTLQKHKKNPQSFFLSFEGGHLDKCPRR